jgi:hypothetical protein
MKVFIGRGTRHEGTAPQNNEKCLRKRIKKEYEITWKTSKLLISMHFAIVLYPQRQIDSSRIGSSWTAIIILSHGLEL